MRLYFWFTLFLEGLAEEIIFLEAVASFFCIFAGMFAVASLMVGTVTARLAPSQAINATIIEKNPNELFSLKSVQVAVAVTFTSGIILVRIFL